MNVKKKPIPETGEISFETEVLRARKPVLVGFLASWSRPCEMLRPVLDEVAAHFASSLTLFTINADDNPILGLRYEVQFIPTLILFIGGLEQIRITGITSGHTVISRLQSCLAGCEPGGSGHRQRPATAHHEKHGR
jgi:thioredoxin 1